MTSEPSDDERPAPRPGRRDVLMVGAGAVLGAAAVGAGGATIWRDDGGTAKKDEKVKEKEEKEEKEEPASAPPLPRLRFVSTQLTAPETTVWRRKGADVSAGLLFTTPLTPHLRGVIYDDAGSPVWIEPDGNACTDLRVQQYRGRPVVTYWTGEFLQGIGNGKGVLLDEHYQTVAEVRAGNGLLADLHEFRLTSRGTALLTLYPTLPWDLTALGGPSHGYVWDGRVQEVDVETGEVLFEWAGLDHIGLEETYEEIEDDAGTAGNPFDPIHINSVEEDGDDLLISCRHTSALYRIDRRTGQIVWRFGGKRSDIEVPEDGDFGWQHDLRRQPDGTLTIYDNHESEEEADGISAALRFRIDEETMTSQLVQRLQYKGRYGYAMGNAQYLDDGHVLVGWGMDPYATEFDADGEVVFELQQLGQGSYRTYRFEWDGLPTTQPDIGMDKTGVHASWNGATAVEHWRLLAGADDQGVRSVATVARDGFETTIPYDGAEPAVQVEALDSRGRGLGRSRVLGG
ncbi:MAG: arylsulfotransferase family protein [Nocardioides sp.]